MNNQESMNLKAEYPSHYRVQEVADGHGFEAIYKGRTRVGKADTEHDARILAANHCFDRAMAAGGCHIVVSPVESISLSYITRVRTYKATPLSNKQGPTKGTRSVKLKVDDTPVILKGGEYYVCHGLEPLTLREAYWDSYHAYGVGDCKHLRTVEEVRLRRDKNPKTATLVTRCACGRRSEVPNYDFTAAYHCEPDCQARKTMRKRGWSIDRDGDLVNEDKWEVDPAELMRNWTPPPVPEKPQAEFEPWQVNAARVEKAKKELEEKAKADRKARERERAKSGEDDLDDEEEDEDDEPWVRL